MAKSTKYTVNDGKLILTLAPMEEGGYLVRSPMDPEILASAKTITEAYEKAYDVRKSLIASRREWAKKKRRKAAG